MTGTDQECVKHCLNGHPEAYQQLVRRYQAPLLSFLAGRLGDLERAEEAAQEAFVRAFFALGKLRTAEAFFSWLLGIADRVAAEQQRAERRYRLALASVPQKVPQGGQEGDQALQQAVAELPASHAEVVLLRYYGEMSCAQIGEHLSLPLGTVTKRLSRAYGMLRESLRQAERRAEPSEV